MMNSQVVIGIPIYKSNLSLRETASLKQVFRVLGHHPICLITFREIDMTNYIHLLKNDRYTLTYFDKSYFESLNGYNKLLINLTFYKRFWKYDFLLIYQLDAWVFRDELNKWCNSNYDYLGAPWFSSDNPNKGLPHFLGIGNGGFSLRNIQSHLKALNQFSYVISPYTIIKAFTSKPSFSTFWNMIRNLTIGNNSHYLLGKPEINEDVFWGRIIKRNYPWFKAPDMITAAKFATETNAEKIYNLMNKKLPFGCHGWDKYDTAFWSTHIL
ncbi:DUF5672 family protein [Pedobacter agri]|uniref:DUF5672 family protein n=1 Tax=Pedobacter agri TaxID=454586 RepID=UPI00292F9996|nr:DUF5672 family protein [Pedobacter agri]